MARVRSRSIKAASHRSCYILANNSKQIESLAEALLDFGSSDGLDAWLEANG